MPLIRFVLSTFPVTFRGAFIGLLAAGLAFSSLAGLAKAQVPESEVRAKLGSLFQTFLGRPLTDSEHDTVTEEFIGLFGKEGCGDLCAKALAWNMELIASVEANPNTPTALRIRHVFVQATYFSKKQFGSKIQRLFAEPDPIRVVNREDGRLMTERDIVALANLSVLAETGEFPDSEWSPGQISKIASHLNALVGTVPDSRHMHMPPLWAMAAPFWAGVKKLWPDFDAKERQTVRSIVAKPIDVIPSASLLAATLELSQKEANEVRSAYTLAASIARINRTARLAIRATGDYMTTMAIINGMHEAVNNQR